MLRRWRDVGNLGAAEESAAEVASASARVVRLTIVFVDLARCQLEVRQVGEEGERGRRERERWYSAAMRRYSTSIAWGEERKERQLEFGTETP
jgi:hypothetical protein